MERKDGNFKLQCENFNIEKSVSYKRKNNAIKSVSYPKSSKKAKGKVF